MIATTIVAGFVTGCSYESNALMSILAGIGIISFLCALFSKVYRMDVPYIPFMAGNIVGLIVYLYIISKYESIGKTYMISTCPRPLVINVATENGLLTLRNKAIPYITISNINELEDVMDYLQNEENQIIHFQVQNIIHY